MRTENFEQAWPHIEPAVMQFRQHTKETVFAEIESGRSRLWSLPNSATVTTLRKYPCGRRSFFIWLGGGDLDEIVDWVNNQATPTAIANGCDEMRINGRRGWVRVLGFKDTGAIAVKDLNHDH